MSEDKELLETEIESLIISGDLCLQKIERLEEFFKDLGRLIGNLNYDFKEIEDKLEDE